MQRIHLVSTALRLAVAACLFAVGTVVMAQVAPIKRYNTASESMHLLQRCGELNDERREWLQRLRGEARRTLDWTAGQWTAHDASLKAEFDQRYPAVSKEKCSELARAIDNERKTLAR
jgi:hypothetical protein